MSKKSTLNFLLKGVSYIPDDGAASGIVPDMTVEENILARWHVQASSLTVSGSRHGDMVQNIIERFDIRPPKKEAKASLLSGGNMQKVLVAREVSGDTKVLVAINPTKGLDIRSQIITRNAISSLKESGCSVLLISEDLPELFSLSDRIVCMHAGKIVGEWSRGKFDVIELGLKMAGG
jgi:simple sugar transport system ATP-binding protein